MGFSRKSRFSLSYAALPTSAFPVNRYPEDCRCTIRPRSKNSEELILEAQLKVFSPT